MKEDAMTGTNYPGPTYYGAPVRRTGRNRLALGAGVALAATVATIVATLGSSSAVVQGQGHAASRAKVVVSKTQSGLPPLAEQAQRYSGELGSIPSTPLSHEEDEEVEHEENAEPTSTKQLIY